MTTTLHDIEDALFRASNILQKAGDYSRADRMTEKLNAQHVAELLAEADAVLAQVRDHVAVQPGPAPREQPTATDAAAPTDQPGPAPREQPTATDAAAPTESVFISVAGAPAPETVLELLRRAVQGAAAHQVPFDRILSVVSYALKEISSTRRSQAVGRILELTHPGPRAYAPEATDHAERLYDLFSELAHDGLLKQ